LSVRRECLEGAINQITSEKAAEYGDFNTIAARLSARWGISFEDVPLFLADLELCRILNSPGARTRRNFEALAGYVALACEVNERAS